MLVAGVPAIIPASALGRDGTVAPSSRSQLTTDFTESDSAIPRTGNIGLQIHSGAPSEAWSKEIEIEELQVAR